MKLFDELCSVIPHDSLRAIGAAIADGWLATEEQEGRRYFLKETAGLSNGQPTVYHAGGGKVIPWWELYVQLADYARLRAIAEARGIEVRMEDRQMDITVWAGGRMLLYVENKVREQQATLLLKKMRNYGEQGFDMDAPDKGNDPLRKAKYLFQDDCRPAYFALSAVGHQRLFTVEYMEGDDHQFRLHEKADSITAPLLEDRLVEPLTASPPRSPADALSAAIEILSLERFRDAEEQIWISPGSKGTAFNAYITSPETGKEAIILGVYRTGRAWTDCKGIGPGLASRLASRLSVLGIDMAPEKEWCYWTQGGQAFTVVPGQSLTVAEAVLDALIAR